MLKHSHMFKLKILNFATGFNHSISYLLAVILKIITSQDFPCQISDLSQVSDQVSGFQNNPLTCPSFNFQTHGRGRKIPPRLFAGEGRRRLAGWSRATNRRYHQPTRTLGRRPAVRRLRESPAHHRSKRGRGGGGRGSRTPFRVWREARPEGGASRACPGARS